MCGIAGLLSCDAVDHAEQAQRMSQAVAHRGPDDLGALTRRVPAGTLSLLHRRLSILDVSAAGHQPMVLDAPTDADPQRQLWIVFNGEIFNFRQLATELVASGAQLRSGSDTEVILQLWQRHGEACVARLRGMFAFALYDTAAQTLHLARDPLGIKPLYLFCDPTAAGIRLAFASELGALRDVLGSSLDLTSLALFLQFGSIPAPHTLYIGVHSMEPGTLSRIELTTLQIETRSIWNYADVLHAAAPLTGDYRQTVATVRDALLESVRLHLVSDVPVGAFLSGGIDSSAVVSLMRQAGHQELDTFSIGFDESPYDESQYAELASRTWRTRHHSWRLTYGDFTAHKAAILGAMDQPSVDGVNTYFVSKLAHDHGLKVVTSGLGGDEFFLGYPSFGRMPKLWRAMRWAPRAWRQPLSALLGRVGGDDRLQKLAGMAQFSQFDSADLYLAFRGLLDPWRTQSLLGVEASEALRRAWPRHRPDDALHSARVGEVMGYMRSQLLRDSDVFSMAHGLELRVPLVDQQLATLLAAVDPQHFAGGPLRERATPKALLVDAVGDIPDALVYRMKIGFMLPINVWLAREAAWRPQSRLLADNAMAQQLCRRFVAGRLSWAIRWALEIVDGVCHRHGW